MKARMNALLRTLLTVATLSATCVFAVAPTVSITAPANNATYVAPASITFNANAADSDGTVTKVDFYNGATKIGTDTTAPYSFAWTNVAVGTYTITAKATDNSGAVTTSAAITVKVNANVAPTVSITSPGNNAAFVAPGAITINATAADTDGTITKVDFYNGTTLLGSDTSSPYSFAWNNVAVGTYSLTTKATDNKGAVTTSAAIAVTVNANAAPTVSITSPANNASFAAPAAITINATAADTDGTITKVDFYNGTTLLGSDTTSPYSYAWSNVAVGTYSLTAKATDSKGAVTASAAISVSVATNQLPTITFNEPVDNGPAIYAPADIALGATASDPDGTIAKVEFFRGTTKLGEALSAPYRFVWTNVAAGTYSLTAKATDNRGAVATSAAKSVTVTANPNPASVSFSLNGLSFRDKSVFASTQSLTHSIFYSFPSGGGFAQRAQIYANSVLVCETAAAPELSTGRLACNAAAMAVGTYSISAKITGPNGLVTVKTAGTIYIEASPTISALITKPLQGEKLWEGRIDVEGDVTLPAGATFKLYRNIYSCTDTQFDIETPATTAGARFTATHNWIPNQDSPPACLRAVAVATDGRSAQSVVSNIEYLRASAVIVNPAPGVVYTPTVNVDVKANVPPGGRVEINGVVATLNGSNYRAAVPLVVGSNSIGATVLVGTSALVTSATVDVTYTAAIDRTLSITQPVEGEKIQLGTYDPEVSKVTVTGTVTGVAATTVLVRDTFGSQHLADIVNGSFTLSVPVSDEDNWIDVTAYGPGGAAATKRVHFYATTTATDAIVLTSPAACSVIPATPGNITLSALTRTRYPVARINYLANNVVVATSTTAPFDAQWNGVPSGSYQINAHAFRTVYDNVGNPSEQFVYASTSVGVTVGTPNVPPTCTLIAPANNASYALGQNIPLEATATDADGSIAKVEFFDGTTLVASLTAPPYRYAWASASAGAHSVSARVTDNQGATTSCPAAVVQVSTNRAPSVSILGPAPGTLINEGGGVILEPGVGDADGTVVKVQLWRGTTMLSEQTTAPFTFTLTQLAAGSYTLFARAFDNLGASTNSNSITFQVNALPVVSLTSPTSGMFTAPATIPIAVTATDPDGTIQRVEISSSGNIIATLTTLPYTFNWANVPEGSYAITANAFDNAGASLDINRRPRADIAVNAPVVTGPVPSVGLLTPASNSAYAAPALVMLQASASSANSTIAKVEFFANGVKIGESNVPPHKYAWINVAAGTYQLSVKTTDALGASASSGNATITVMSAASLSNIAFNGINAPVGSTTTIADDRVMVTGKVLMPLNAALSINGYLASVDREGNFFVNNLLLKSGNNTITLTLNQFAAAPLSETRIVNATGLQEVALSVNTTQGPAPAKFTLTVDNLGNVALDRVELDFDGDGTVDMTIPSSGFANGSASAILSVDAPGEYTVTAKAYMTGASTPFYNGKIRVRAVDPHDQAARINAVLEQFRERLQVGDVAGATQFITESLRNYYQTRFNLIAADLPAVAAELANPISISIQGNTATALISRQVGQSTFVFTISFVRDGRDAIWRIDGM